MRYSSALVLSTLAAGQAAAANIRHAGFHARRAAEHKREADFEAVDWKDVSYDLSHVDWSSVFATPTPTPTPTPSPEPSKAEVKVEAAEPTSVYTPPAAKTSEAPEPKKTHASGGIGQLLDGVMDHLEGIGAHFKKAWEDEHGKGTFDINSLAPTANNGVMWLGDDGDFKSTFINDGSQDITLVCWSTANAWISAKVPTIAIKLASGAQETVSHAGKASGACAPAYPGTKLGMSGALAQTWYEFTFGEHGTFDLSKNPAMDGVNYVAKGSKCTSDKDTCIFQCTGGQTSCQIGYELINCSAGNGGGQGFDKIMQGVGGGCATNDNKEHVKVTFS